MNWERRDCPLRSRSLARRLHLNVLHNLEEAGASAGVTGVTGAGSPLDDGRLEAIEVDVQTERVASSVTVFAAGRPASKPDGAATAEHGIVLSLPSPPTVVRRLLVGENDSSGPTLVGLHYRCVCKTGNGR